MALPGHVRVGSRNVFVPDRRGSCGTWREHLGPLLHDPGGDHRRQQRRCRVRPPRACRWRRATDDRTRHRRLPVLDLLAARHAAGARRRFNGGARLLRPARRSVARGRHRPVRHVVSLGPAPGVGGRGRVARAGDRVPLRRVRRRRRHRSRRSRQALGHAQRAVLFEPLRVRHRVHGPRPHVGRRRLRRRSPPVARSWLGRGAPALPCARRGGRGRLELQPDASGQRRPCRRRRGGCQGRSAQPLVCRADRRTRLPDRRHRRGSVVRRRAPRGRPRGDRRAARRARGQLLQPIVRQCRRRTDRGAAAR